MQEKILEKPVNKSFKVIYKNINKKLRTLSDDYSDQWVNKFGIVYRWNKKKNKLLIKSTKYPVWGYMLIFNKKVEVWLDMPFHLQLLTAPFREKIIEILDREIEKLVY